MTNTEAIKILNECRDRGFERTTYTIEEYHTARDMAIKALQEQNCDQCEVGNPCLYCEYEFKAQADGEYISKGKMLMFLNDMRFGIAPDETVADDDERREREAQVDVLDKIRAEIELFRMNDSSNIFMKAYNDGINIALRILDRYREGVSD